MNSLKIRCEHIHISVQVKFRFLDGTDSRCYRSKIPSCEHNSKQRRVIYRVAGGGEGQRQLDNGKQESTEDHEVEYDRAGNAFIERLEAVGATIQRATQSLRAGARRLTNYVQLHCGGQRHAVETSELLKQSSERIDNATPAVREFLQAKKMLKQQKLERAEPKSKSYHSSYGASR